MYDHELTVVIQQERERAIREAMLHHRYGLAGLAEGRSLARRLLALLHTGQRPRAESVDPATIEERRPADACRGQAGVRRGTTG